ncbi:MAG: hypothetical protein INR69_19915, partial [Mucilaginibacter polytrichastri]|nr:hypothetical protein [Mucilaginibacter polytrichastri]
EKDGTLYLPVTNTEGKKMYRIVGKNGKLASQEEIDRSLNGRDSTETRTRNSNDDVYRDEQNADDTSNNGLPWVGDVVDELPQGTKAVTLNDKKYFVSPAEVYYEQTKEYGKDQYRVVRTPASEGTGKE